MKPRLIMTQAEMFHAGFLRPVLPNGAYIDVDLSEKYGCFKDSPLLDTYKEGLFLNIFYVDCETTNGDLYIHCEDTTIRDTCMANMADAFEMCGIKRLEDTITQDAYMANVIDAFEKSGFRKREVTNLDDGSIYNQFCGAVKLQQDRWSYPYMSDDVIIYIEVTTGVEYEEIKPTDIAVHITLITDTYHSLPVLYTRDALC